MSLMARRLLQAVRPSNQSSAQMPVWSDEFNGNNVSFATDSGGGTWRTRGPEGGYPAGTAPSVTTG